MRRAKFGAVVVLCVVALLGGGGCKKKGPSPLDSELGANGEMGEGGLGGRGGGSMARAQRGETPEEDGILKDVHFGYDEADLDAEGQSIIAQNAQWLRANPNAKVEVEGHCDDRGTIEYNLGLGSRRAKSAKDALVTSGIASGRISTISYGKELPLCHEQSESCFARNRRVHFVVLGQ
jgi:peptidoglycan-associated lipoprotein